MKVYSVNVGPLLGATTANSVRLSGRVSPPDDSSNLRAYLVMRYRALNSHGDFNVVCGVDDIGSSLDYMGMLDINGLLESCVYEYQLGFVYAATPVVEISALDWEWTDAGGLDKPAVTHTFKTFTDDNEKPVSFIVGSCRNMRLLKINKKWEGDKDGEDGDLTFMQILKKFPPKSDDNISTGIDFVMMTGDQIYADTKPESMYKNAEEFEEYTERYHKAFGTINASLLLASYPTYMTWDDHEVINDWPPVPRSSDRDDSEFKKQDHYINGSRAYAAYQVLQSPRDCDNAVPSKFWYDFSVGCVDIFVMDVRSEREFEKKGNFFGWKFYRTKMLGKGQVDALKEWLTKPAETKRVKLIVSAVPVFPDGTLPYFPFKLGGKDTWRTYPAQREEILDFIRDQNIPRVSFLSGDVHCSFSAKLSMGKDSPGWIYNVIASAFHWHTFGWNDSSFFVNKYLKDGEGRKTQYYVKKIDEKVITQDNYTHITCDIDKLVVTVYERETGDEVSKETLPFLK